MDRYLAEKDATATDPGRLRDAWKALAPTFAGLRPDQVTRDLCRQYAATRNRAAGTVNKELRTLRAGLRLHDPHTPAQFLMMPGTPPRDRYLNRDEYAALVAGAASPHIRLAIVLMLGTAARVGAVLDLTWSRVDFGKGLIRLATGEGGRKGRATVPMTAAVRAALEEAAPAALSPYVIEYAGGRVVSIKKGFARAVKRAGLEGVTPHVLRHTAAVWMAEAGISMSEIAQVLGHSDSRITERVYARYSPSYLKGAVSALEV